MSSLQAEQIYLFFTFAVSASDKMQENAGQKMQVCSGEECNMVHSDLSAGKQAERVSKWKEQTGWIS